MLAHTHLCRGLDTEELTRLAAIASVRSWTAGSLMFSQGDRAEGFFVLLSGLVRIYKSSPDGREYTLHRIGPGQMFAEAAVFDTDRYPANAAALEDSQTAFFPRHAFVSLLAESPRLALKIIAGLAAFVREFNQKLEDLSLREVPARLASYLLEHAAESPDHLVALDQSKTDLAKSLGTISETLSRVLRKMIDRGLVEVDGPSIMILDREGLETVADGDRI